MTTPAEPDLLLSLQLTGVFNGQIASAALGHHFDMFLTRAMAPFTLDTSQSLDGGFWEKLLWQGHMTTKTFLQSDRRQPVSQGLMGVSGILFGSGS